MAASPGRIVNGFRFISPIDSGAAGVVSFAYDTLSEQNVAIKEVSLNKVPKEMSKRAFTEAHMLSRLRHPNVVKYYGSFRVETVLCIVMDVASEGDLESLVVRTQEAGAYLDEEFILTVFIQLCHALDYCHRNLVLHRDVKTDNVFLFNERHIKLGDFGFTRELEDATQMARTLLGTPRYLAPELCQRKAYSEKADVWAAGVVLYRLIALAYPFDGANLPELFRAIVNDNCPRLPEQYSVATSELTRWTLIKTANRRPNVSDILTTPFVKDKACEIALKHADLHDVFAAHAGAKVVEPDPNTPTVAEWKQEEHDAEPTPPALLHAVAADK